MSHSEAPRPHRWIDCPSPHRPRWSEQCSFSNRQFESARACIKTYAWWLDLPFLFGKCLRQETSVLQVLHPEASLSGCQMKIFLSSKLEAAPFHKKWITYHKYELKESSVSPYPQTRTWKNVLENWHLIFIEKYLKIFNIFLDFLVDYQLSLNFLTRK